MNDAVLLIVIMVGILAGMSWLSLVTTVIADLVRDWRGDAVRRETERQCGEVARAACNGCRYLADWIAAQAIDESRMGEAPPIQADDGPAAVAEAERLMRERRGTW